MTPTRPAARKDAHYLTRLQRRLRETGQPLTQRELLGALLRFAARWEGHFVQEAMEIIGRSRSMLALLPAFALLTVVHIWIWAALAFRLGNLVPLFVVAMAFWTVLLIALIGKIERSTNRTGKGTSIAPQHVTP